MVCAAGVCVSKGTLFAHTSSSLYKLDLKTKSFALVGKFTFNKSSGSVTDIALDRSSSLYLNANGRQRGWGAEGGLLAVFDPPFALESTDLQLV